MRHSRNLFHRTTHHWEILAFVCVSLLCANSERGQSSSAQSFDIISIKPNRSTNSGSSLRDGTHGIPGHFGTTDYSLRDVMEYAYNVKAGQIEALPGWASSEKYDIDAKMDDAVAEQERSLPRDQEAQLIRTRVQSLLADRFGLRLHHQTKDMPVLALMVAKSGPKLSTEAAKPLPGDAHPLPPGSFIMKMARSEWIMTSNQASLDLLIRALSGQPEIRGHILVDQTDLNGKYTFTLQWAPQNLSAATEPSSESPGPSLFTALQQQLGLRLESTRAPVDILVVDHVEPPSPN